MTRPWRVQRFAFIALLILAGALLLAACGDDDDDSGSGDGISGTIDIDGSSTVYPVSEGVAEEFSNEYSDVQITVGFSGTGGGFEKFCNGEIQIADASRPVKQEELDACAEEDIEMTEFRVAIDGLSVVVNPNNDWVTCLTVEQLTAMFGPNSTVETWADVNPEWPAENIAFYLPGTDSGTFEYFTETIGGEAGATRTANIQTSEDDNVLVQGVQGDQHAIGYFGYAYYVENQDRVKIVPIDNGNGCVEPTDETVNNGEYAPLSRPLFVYVDNEALATQEQVAEFLRFYMTDGRAIIPEVGYVEFPDEVYQENLDDIDAAIAGETVPMWSQSAVEKTSAEPGTSESSEDVVDLELSGTLDIDGSSTVYPVSEAVAEEFSREHPDVQITVGFSGTGGGFEKFCNGEIQIADASRPVKQEEIDACAENGVEMTEFRVAIDGLSVVVNAGNDWVTCLTVDQLSTMFGPDSTVETWADVNSEWPAERISFYIPGTDSGTFEYFTETIGGEAGATRQANIQTSEDDNVLVTGIQGDEFAIGYFGYAYYAENQDRVKIVAIDNGNGCVEPNDETVNSGEYAPLSRPLFIYARDDALADDPTVREFVRYYLTEGRALVPQVGYVPYPDEIYEQGLTALETTTS